MKKSIFLIVLFGVFAMLSGTFVFAQEDEGKKETVEGYVFTIDKKLKDTPVKNQYKSGTCWSFSSVAFLEAELLRMGKEEYDLSDMWAVRHSYSDKAEKYVRMHGSLEFGPGGAFHDVTNVYRKYGMVPEEVYTGLQYKEDKHVHAEMDHILQSFVDAVIENKNRKLTPVWHQAFDAVLDTYLGEIPESFEYHGKTYTPKSFADELGINPDDYVELTSFTHHPYYSKFIIEVPDNWAWDEVYNIPLDELAEVFDYAVNNGYPIGWGSDVSEKGFSWKNAVAVVPDKNAEDLSDTEKERWEKLTDKEKQKALYSFNEPGDEMKITPELRQEAFNNYNTTDDHGMLIMGMAHDQKGNKYYMVKNSWGTDTENEYKGYFFASEPFVLYKTIDIMVHKDAIPKHIRKKLNI